jgi:parallel beta-helix repeat protein
MRTATFVFTTCLFFVHGTALADNVDVFPGDGTPLQDAIDDAEAGDVLRLHAGTFFEAVAVTKPLTLVGNVGAYRKGGPTAVAIDGGCSELAAVSVQSDDVRIKGLRIFGGTFFGVDIDGRSHVTVDAVFTADTCGEAEYGINVFNSTRIKVTKNWAQEYEDAGIYVGGVQAAADVRVLRNFAVDNERGIIVEDAGIQSTRLRSNRIAGNGDGIFLHRADGITIVRNVLAGNDDVGIELDAGSDGNLIEDNDISGSANDVLDNGDSNCWKDNVFSTGSVAPCDD